MKKNTVKKSTVKKGWWIIVCFLLVGTVQADQGHLIRASDLRSAPYIDASLVANLPTNATLNVLQRKGGWYQVKLPDARQGWVRMDSVRFSSTDNQAASGGGLLGWLGTGRDSARWSTATTGVRGLSDENLKNATPDPAAVSSLNQYKASAAAARNFAQALKLKTQSVPFLPDNNE